MIECEMSESDAREAVAHVRQFLLGATERVAVRNRRIMNKSIRQNQGRPRARHGTGGNLGGERIDGGLPQRRSRFGRGEGDDALVLKPTAQAAACPDKQQPVRVECHA